jgi:cell division protein FtsB
MPAAIQHQDPIARRIRTVAIFQIGLIVVIGVLTAVLTVQITRLERQRAVANAELQDVSNRVRTLREEISALEQQKATLDAQVKALSDRNLALRADLVVNDATLEILQKRDPGLTARAIATAELRPRLYIQVATAENEALANRLRPKLEQAGFLVPRVERLPSMPRTPQVRYFHAEDEAYAQRVVNLIAGDLPGVQVASFTSAPASARMRPHHLELWF